MPRKPFTPPEQAAALRELNRELRHPWRIEAGRLTKTFHFQDFVEAFGFMSQVALLAERANHHPDWCNSYKEVTITLFTHEAQGLTEKDFALARTIETYVNLSSP
jgi:4a-hydroxytetrahydrobiopterin dehydratase